MSSLLRFSPMVFRELLIEALTLINMVVLILYSTSQASWPSSIGLTNIFLRKLILYGAQWLTLSLPQATVLILARAGVNIVTFLLML